MIIMIMMKNAIILAADIPLLLGIVLALGIIFIGAGRIVMGRRIFSIEIA